MNSSRRKANATPMAIDAVRRKIMSSVQTAEREAQQFLQRYTGNVGTPPNWPRYLHTAGTLARRPYETLRDYKDLDAVLRRVRGDPNLESFTNREYDELRRVVERGKMFEHIEYELKNGLVGAYEDQLDKFCRSFYHKAYGEDLKSVKEYETKIVAWRQEIQQRLDLVDKNMDEVDKCADSLVDYVDNYPAIVANMEEACQGMIAACAPMKRWITDDALYPNKIQDEITSYTRRKKDLKEVIGTTEENRKKEEIKMKKTAADKARLEKQLLSAVEEQEYYKRREQDVMEGYVKTEAELSRKNKDLQEFNNRRRGKKKASPTVYNFWTGLADAIKGEIQVLEEKRSVMAKQVNALKDDQERIQKEVDQLAVGVEARADNHEIVTERVKMHGEDLELVQQDIEHREQRIAILKKIRELKLRSHSLNKIDKFGYHPENLAEAKPVQNDESREAFDTTSSAIGKDWPTLYQQLPFNPPRDSQQRTRDIEIIDLTHRRLDQGPELLAQKALEKWRRLSSMATVDELTRTLRKIKRQDIASRIQPRDPNPV